MYIYIYRGVCCCMYNMLCLFKLVSCYLSVHSSNRFGKCQFTSCEFVVVVFVHVELFPDLGV